MAHECPDCGEVCFCGGDIDDCLMNNEDDVNQCIHYQRCQDEEDDFEGDYEDD